MGQNGNVGPTQGWRLSLGPGAQGLSTTALAALGLAEYQEAAKGVRQTWVWMD